MMHAVDEFQRVCEDLNLKDDRPLDYIFRQIIGRLLLIPGGTIASYNAAGGGGDGYSYWEPRAAESAQELDRPEVRYSAAWRTCQSDDARRDVIVRAGRELLALSKAPAPVEESPETESELTQRILEAGRGFSIRDVSVALRVTETRVRKARVAGNADMATGERLDVGQPPPTSVEDHARELGERGLSERQIAFITKLPKTRVRRLLGRAA